MLITVFAFTAIVFWLGLRYRTRELEHRRMLAAIEKGVDPLVPPSAPWSSRTYLLHGMIWLFVGISVFLGLTAIAVTSRRQQPWESRLAAVNDARFRGATPEEIQMLLNSPRQEEGVPMGIGFLGLIPASVGIAYLIFYRLESKKLLS
jgi:hypothetical protein